MKQHPNSEVLVLGEDGTNLGRMPYRDAQALASNHNLDLVNVNQADGVEVFKIMDHGKWKYEKNKHKQKKPHRQTKEMNFKVRIDPHDQEIKINRIRTFLKKGYDVKIAVQLKGREKANPRQADDKLNEVLKVLEEEIQIQQRKGSQSMAFAVIRPIVKKSGSKKNNESKSGNGHTDKKLQVTQSEIQNKRRNSSTSSERGVAV